MAEPADANLDSERSLMVVYENFTFPLSARRELENNQMQELGVAFDEECEQSGRNQSSFEQFGYDARRWSMVIFSLVLFAVALLIGAGVALQKYGGPAAAAPPDPLALMGFVALYGTRLRWPRVPFKKIGRGILHAIGNAIFLTFAPTLVFTIGASLDPIYSLLAGFATAAALYGSLLILHGPNLRDLKKQLGATFKGKEKTPPREYVIVYNEVAGIAYLDKVNREMLQKNLDHRARVIGNKQQAKIVGALFGSALFALPIGAFLYWAGFPSEFALAGAVVVGTILGAVPGALFGKANAPQPLWLMRMAPVACQAVGCEREDCDLTHLGYGSIIHRRFAEDEYEMTEVIVKGEKVEQIIPQIYRATTTYRMSLAKDAAEDYKGGRSPLQKIEVALVGMLALASIGLLALFAIVLLDTPAVTQQPQSVSAQQRSP